MRGSDETVIEIHIPINQNIGPYSPENQQFLGGPLRDCPRYHHGALLVLVAYSPSINVLCISDQRFSSNSMLSHARSCSKTSAYAALASCIVFASL